MSLLLAGLALSLALPSPAASRSSAIRAYNRAIRLRTTLESRPESTRRLADYQKAVDAFEAVYRTDPAYRLASSALAAAGALYEEMGRRYSNDRYYLKSIQQFQTLMGRYPNQRLSRDSLFTIGEIYRTDLEDPVQARTTFTEFIKKYPKSDRAAEARAKVRALDLALARWAKASPAAAGAAQHEALSKIPEVTDIRDWVGPNYTRVVISVEAPVTFDTARLKNPDRIYFDLQNSQLSAALVGKSFPVENAFLRQVRIAQYRPNVTRVVLDVQKIRDYSVFSLPNPFRLVIDIHGPPAPLRAKLEATPVAKEAKNAKGEKAPGGTAPGASAVTAAATPPRWNAGRHAPKQGGSSSQAGEQATHVEPAAPPVETTKPNPRAVSTTAEAPIPPATPMNNGSRTLTRALGLKIARIVIDPGHGGYDTGTIGPGDIEEKNVVLDVALRLRKLLEEKTGSEVIMTRTTDTFIPLEERTAIANEKDADLFISIHANASRDPSARGLETYYLNFTSDPEALALAARENASSQESVHQLQDMIKKIALNEKVEESREFARDVENSMYRDLSRDGDPQPNRGVKKAPFVVLIGANMPSILAEISFLTNPRDARLLRRPQFREKIAQALYAGVVRYMNELGGIKVAQQARVRPSASGDDPPGN